MLIHGEKPTRFESLGFEDQSTAEWEDFQERLKLSPASDYAFRRRVAEYLTTHRGRLEACRNYKRYPFAKSPDLPECDPLCLSLDKAIARRRSCRSFGAGGVTSGQLSTILKAARVNRSEPVETESNESIGLRPYSSAGGLYPIELYLAVIEADGIPPAVYYYSAREHRIRNIASVDLPVLRAALGEMPVDFGRCRLVLFTTSVMTRTTVKYGTRGLRFGMLENGALSLMLELCIAATGLLSVRSGAYYDERVNRLLGVDGRSETVTDCLLVGAP